MSASVDIQTCAEIQIDPPPLLEVGDSPVWCVSYTDDSTCSDMRLGIYEVSIQSRSLLPHVSYTIRYLGAAYEGNSYEADVHADRLFPADWVPDESRQYDLQASVKAKIAHCRRTPGLLPEWTVCNRFPPEFAPIRGRGALSFPFMGDPQACSCTKDIIVPGALQTILDTHGLTLHISSSANFASMTPLVTKLLDRYCIPALGVGRCHVFHLVAPRHQQSRRMDPYSGTAVLRHLPATRDTKQRVFQILCLDGGAMLCSALLCIVEALLSLLFPSSTTLVFPIDSKYEHFVRAFGFSKNEELTHPLFDPNRKAPDNWALYNRGATATTGISLMFQLIDCLAYSNCLKDLGPAGELAAVLNAYLHREASDTKLFGREKFMALWERLRTTKRGALSNTVSRQWLEP